MLRHGLLARTAEFYRRNVESGLRCRSQVSTCTRRHSFIERGNMLSLKFGRPRGEPYLAGPFSEVRFTGVQLSVDATAQPFATLEDHQWNAANGRYSRIDITGPLYIELHDGGSGSKRLGPFPEVSAIDDTLYLESRVFASYDKRNGWFAFDDGRHWPTIVVRSQATKSVPRSALVVEDNIDSGKSFVMLLGVLGHNAHLVTDPLQAMEVARRIRPDVAFLDIGLPNLDGFELAKLLKNEFPQLCLVAVTGYGLPEFAEKARQTGFHAYLKKPAEMRAVEDILATLLKK